VGKGAKRRAHQRSTIAALNGGHASLCPPYEALARIADPDGIVWYFKVPEPAIAPGTVACQSGKPSFRRFSAIRSRVVPEKTIACLYFEIVRSG
jgi:hypothetical protein